MDKMRGIFPAQLTHALTRFLSDATVAFVWSICILSRQTRYGRRQFKCENQDATLVARMLHCGR